MTEQIMRDIYASDRDWNFPLLRYFNPAGAHPSGDIGENPNGIPNNLMPYITQVAIGRLKRLRVFGDNYPTVDGTGVRDYIHVMDLAAAHVCAVEKLGSNPGVLTYNLGTGRGSSVLEVIAAFEKATEIKIPYEIVGRRAGDVAAAYADPTKAEKELGWRTKLDLDDMCRDGWNWQQRNPNGFPWLRHMLLWDLGGFSEGISGRTFFENTVMARVNRRRRASGGMRGGVLFGRTDQRGGGGRRADGPEPRMLQLPRDTNFVPQLSQTG
jgi:hypothetical protein